MIYIILLAYILLLIGTFSIRIYNQYLLINDLATEFYKIDFDEMNDSDDIVEFNFKKIDFKSFIPIYNIIKASLCLVDYNKHCPEIVDDLEAICVVRPMAIFEKYEYMKNPTFFNLLKVLRNGYKRLNNANYFQVVDNDGYEDGQVQYEKDKDITILDATGVFEKMNSSEILDIINTNDAKHQFSNFIHDDGDKMTVVTANKEVKDKIDAISDAKRNDKISKLRELREYYLSLKGKAKQKSYMNKQKKY